MPGGQLYRYDFTYFLPSDEKDPNIETYAKKVKSVLDKYCKAYIFQCEKTPTTGRLHLQGFVNLVKKYTKDSLGRAFGVHLPGISVRPASDAGTDSLKTYCMKEDTRVLGPWKDVKAEAADAKAKGPDMSDWMIPGIDPRYPFLKYQKLLVEHMTMKHEDRRTVYWLYDANGNTGKSGIKDYLVAKGLSIPLGWMPIVDIRAQVADHKELPVYVWDLTRQKPKGYSVLDLYTGLEDIKGGCFMSTKYKGGVVRMRSPNVWVFSNSLPDFSKLSSDRWVVLELYGLLPNIKIRKYLAPDKISHPSEVPPEITKVSEIPQAPNHCKDI